MFRASTRHNIPSSSTVPGLEVKVNKRGGNASSAGGPSARYPYRLSFYERPPNLDITLDEFETCAIARLRVLAHIESLSQRSLPPAQFHSAIAAYGKEHLPLSSNTAKNVNLDEERRRDEIGHWVLRLSFSRSPDLRERFMKNEVALFKARYETDDKAERERFLRSLAFNWEQVSDQEKKDLEEQLKACMVKGTTAEQFRRESWFKVPWYDVPDLIQQRRVYVKGGSAYVPHSQQSSLVFQGYAHRLEKALEFTAANLPALKFDKNERIGPVLDHLAANYLHGLGAASYQPADGEAAAGVVTADMVDEVARKHFPPCMLAMHAKLKKDHHLKHFGRLQLTLFLKGIGLPLEEALIFWRRGFGSTITDDKFNKEYKYNIRHNYGQEGKRANYPPKSCQQILTTNQPGNQDTHGCPFRHYSEDNLVSYLISTYPGLTRSSPEMREIRDHVKSSHYHLACTRVFEFTHGLKKGEGLGNGESVDHPNKWVDRSRELEKEGLEQVETKKEEPEPMQVD
ncbi:hypothetical protein IAT38_005323 [Cryptococcus sp. DSM 104549]